MSVHETQIQYFQYKIIHRIIACNKKLFDMKIKDSANCTLCHQIDDISHFFFHCPTVQIFWVSFFNWWNNVGYSVVDFPGSISVKHILFGFIQETDDHFVLNYCLQYAKFYVYKHRLFGENNLDIQGLQNYLRWKIRIERQISINEGKVFKFQKFLILHDNLDGLLNA